MVRPRPYTGYTYTVVYPVPGRVYGSRTRPVNGRVHGVAVNGRVGGQRPCTRVVNTPVYLTAVYGRAVIQPCARVMDAPCDDDALYKSTFYLLTYYVQDACTAVLTVHTRSWSCTVYVYGPWPRTAV